MFLFDPQQPPRQCAVAAAAPQRLDQDPGVDILEVGQQQPELELRQPGARGVDDLEVESISPSTTVRSARLNSSRRLPGQ